MNDKSDFFLDITGEVCPMTFVRTKLLVERMGTGQTCEVRLKGSEPLINVPRSLAELGHEILALTPESNQNGDSETDTGIHRLFVRKR